MNKSNSEKAKLLGMPQGTAQARLRKSLLFDMAGRLGLLTCYQCGNTIESIDVFSIEHKVPWGSGNNPVELFFDISNIAYSHIVCNVRAASRPTKKEDVDGKCWCRMGHYSDRENFCNGKRFNGLDDECREHKTIRQGELRKKNGKR